MKRKKGNRKPERDWVGESVGFLKVLRREITVSDSGRSRTAWVCRCACGSLTRVRTDHLKTKRTTSCGKNCKLAHPLGTSKHPAYHIWWGMVRRCYDPRNKSFQNYQEIEVYAHWRDSPEEFLLYLDTVLGPRPSKGHSIDRINNSFGYFPGNLRWATAEKQASNRDTTKYYLYKDSWWTVTELSKISKVNRKLLWERLRRGWSVEDAINLPRSTPQECFNPQREHSTPIQNVLIGVSEVRKLGGMPVKGLVE